ncbi:chemotaxis protein CheB [Methylocystis heyeri]|uniref:GAF domain-containing protein n=1 Tax=Methylocystis heyeri TaxID=391905 RepID=A0A6B8KBD4_9HYPH|nr:chemotaxis protein CheB [Methylocystis heyeri]QGM44375.1 GAF domain-containing protein [Methylocystis heyeri]
MTDPADHAFHTPVCALGGSAGSVAALQSFFSRIEDDLGLAYVVIVHLAPDQPSALGEILATRTRMPVETVTNQIRLQPNRIYIISPNRELVIQGDDLAVRPFTEPRGRRSPIDVFFRSIATARGEGVAVVLSGSGSDGALGVRAIKEAGGVIFVQDPEEAEYPMMPQSAIETGAVDFVAPIESLVKHIADVARSKEAMRSMEGEETERELRQIIAHLRRRTGHDFSNYKRPTILRRLSRRMQVTQQINLGAYTRFLQANADEAKELFSDLLISVTSFFRDKAAFAALAEKAISPLFDQLNGDAPIRVWVVGCASGEEAYSIGMLLLEEASRRGVHPSIQIFASDIDEAALATAREGRYPKAIESDLTEERLRRFFIEDGVNYRVRKELRDLVLFSLHSALKDPPFIRLDLISCRNLLIYLQRELQRQLCSLFHYALKPGGFLFLGSAEAVDATSFFRPLDREARIFAPVFQADKVPPLLPELMTDHRFQQFVPKGVVSSGQVVAVGHAHSLALEHHAPPSVLVDSAHRILHLSPNAGFFFRPTEGPYSPELTSQVRPELRVDLKLALQRAFDTGESTLTMPIPVGFNGGRRLVSLNVSPVAAKEGEGLAQAIVLFLDAGKTPAAGEPPRDEDINQEEVARLRKELAVAQERVSASSKEHELATQELRAVNEELQSINEEYRSTAEELETSKEELQSMNEELQTVNSELKSKLETISSAHNDLQNLMATNEIGTLFLDADLKIKLFTPAVTNYFNITTADIGRVITDFTNRLAYADLEADVASVLKTLLPIERELSTNSGRWLSMGLRPYKTMDGRIEGVVMSLTDITNRKTAEQGLSKELQTMQRLQLLSTKIAESEELSGPLAAVLDALIALIDSDFGVIQLYDEKTKKLQILVQRGFEERFLQYFATVDAASGSVCGLALRALHQVIVSDIEKEPAVAAMREEARVAGYRAVVSTPLVATGGKLVGMISAHFRAPHELSKRDLRLIDICARQAADSIHVYQLQQALRNANQRKNEFLAIVAHELRNPLASIGSSLAVLKRIGSMEGDAKRAREIIERQIQHLTRLAGDLLDISRITRGTVELRLQTVDLNEVVRHALETCEPLVKTNGHKLQTSFFPMKLSVTGDPVRLAQVFGNLLDNAAKYTPKGGKIEVSTGVDGDFAVASVCDNGVGIPAETLPRIFDLFVHLPQEEAAKQSGIGVGLALARSLVALHKGTIAASSDGLGKGSKFTVRLPLVKEAAPD